MIGQSEPSSSTQSAKTEESEEFIPHAALSETTLRHGIGVQGHVDVVEGRNHQISHR
jgi:hypothetical protein